MLLLAADSLILHIVVLKPNYSGELNHKLTPRAEQARHSRTNNTAHLDTDSACDWWRVIREKQREGAAYESYSHPLH